VGLLPERRDWPGPAGSGHPVAFGQVLTDLTSKPCQARISKKYGTRFNIPGVVLLTAHGRDLRRQRPGRDHGFSRGSSIRRAWSMPEPYA
jgi:hypothetical protein